MEKHLIPQLRFSEFESNWFVKKYNQIFSFYSTNSLSREYLNYENGVVKNIHYGDIHTKFATLFDIEKEKVPFVNTDVDLSKIKDENFCQEGDLLIADASEDYNDIGKTTEIINLNNEKLISGLHTFHARPNKFKMAIGFSGYLLQSWKVRKQVMTIAQGTKVLGLATSRLGKINLFITSLPEQQKIASFLTDVDAKISQLTKKAALLEQYKKGVMQKLFNGKLIIDDGELIFTPPSIRFKDDHGNAFPDWEEKELGDISLSYYQGVNTTADKVKYHKRGYPILQAKHITNEVIEFEDAKLIDNLDFQKYKKKYKPLKNDLLISNIGTIGKVVLIKEDIDLLIAWNIFKVTLNLNFVNPDFVLFQLRKISKSGYFERVQTGNATKFVNKTDMLAIKFKIPSLEEQTKIANFLSDIDVKLEALNAKIEQNKVFKKGLLQKMFI